MTKPIALALATLAVALTFGTGVLAGTTSSPAVAAPPGVSVTASQRTARAEALATRFYQPFETGRTSDYDRILTRHWVDRPLAEGQVGRDGLTPVVGYFRSVFPDLDVQITAEHVSDDGRFVTVRTVYSGTQRAEFLGVPATNTKISFRTTDVHRIEGHRIAETWHLEDTYGAYQQLLAAQDARPTRVTHPQR